MKSILPTLLLLLAPLTMSAQQNLVISRLDGRQLIMHIDQIDSIGFTDSDVAENWRDTITQTVTRTVVDTLIVSVPRDSRAVDLGLTRLWASCNLGATRPQDYGDLYAWGETATKTDYSESAYLYYQNDSYQSIGRDISGTQYDAAKAIWGDAWRMPSRIDIKELTTRCTWTATTLDSTPGYLVQGPSGQCIFLPSTGYSDGTSVKERGTMGYYWSSTINNDMPSSAYNINFNGYAGDWYASRAYGFAIRPVMIKQ